MQNSEDITRVERALLFLHRIGIPLRRTGERAKSFLPGVWIEGGTLMYNLEDLRYPGDLFHEAGHLAIIPSMFRHLVPKSYDFEPVETTPFDEALNAYLEDNPLMRPDYTEDPVIRGILQMGECEAIAWSYAAMLASGGDPERCFTEDVKAYNGGGEEVHLMLEACSHYGINGLQAGGMTTTKTYPMLTRWLQI